jgi:hypothetical protein
MRDNKCESDVSATINVWECGVILLVKWTKVLSKHYVNDTNINIMQDNDVLMNTTCTYRRWLNNNSRKA